MAIILPTLEGLGWTEAWASLAATRTEYWPARVAVEHKERYLLYAGRQEYTGMVSGRLRLEAEQGGRFPAVGDWVLVTPPQYDGPVAIQEILPRRNAFVRQAAGGLSTGQTLAANLDALFITTSCNADWNLHRIQRFLTLAHACRIPPVLLLTKLDLIEDPRPLVGSCFEAWGTDLPVIALSARTGEGLEKLQPYLGLGQTVALVGSSGVGKSTLVNRLVKSPLLWVQPIREDDDRGRHTTVTRQLVPLPDGGLLIDTPGIREVGLHDAAEGLEETFSGLAQFAEECRFGNCRHEQEPGCAVLAAIAQGKLSADHLEHYHKLQRENEYHLAREDARLQQERKKQCKMLHRRAKEIYKRHKTR